MSTRKEGAGARVWTLQTVHSRCEEEGECLLWQGAIDVNGQPRASIGGVSSAVRRWVYTVALGKQITGGRMISTTCANRACVAPAHIVAMTRAALNKRTMETICRSPIYRKKFLDGAAMAGHSKLNAKIAEDIRNCSDSDEVQAARYGVDRSSIGKIRRRESYAPARVANSIFNLAETMK